MNSLLYTPAQRGLIAAALTTAFLFYAKPDAFFRPDNGRPRVAAWTARHDQLARATYMPWYIFVIGVGLAVDLFT